jgi:diguanylate cyclase (GGDEF)-like protein
VRRVFLDELARATRAICEAPDADHAIAALLERAHEMFGARRAELVLLSHEGATTAVRARLEPGRSVARPRAIDPSRDAVWNAVAGLRRAVRLPGTASPQVQEELRREGIEIAIAAPIVHAGTFKGALLVADPVNELQGFPHDQVAVVELLAAHAGAALEVDRLSESFAEFRRLERELRHHALHDALTGLANRVLFVERLKHALTRRSTEPLAVLFIDLDDFKSVNDTHGHAAGDRVLIRVAARLQRCLRPHDTAARLGGDEFGVLLEDVVDEAEAEQVADRIAHALRDDGSNGSGGTRISVGIAVARPGVTDSEELLRNADLAMYAAKDRGKDRKAMFRRSMYEQAALRYSLGAELPAAIRNDQLTVHYQPILELDDRRVAGHEALVRWRHPNRGELLPTEFLPIAEASGVMSELFRFTLGRALADCSQPGRLNGGFVCVNVSSSQLEHPHFLADLENALADPEVPADRLILEVVETERMAGLILATTRLEAARRLGVRVAIGDFGAGHSLEHLVRLPVDIIKIPPSLTTDTAHNPRVSALLDAVRSLADELDLAVVAEGLEEEAQLETLTEIGIPYGQGFLLGRPEPFAAQDESQLSVR